MTILIITTALFLLILPLMPAIREWRSKADAKPMAIAHSYAEDRRAEAHRFGASVRKTLAEAISEYAQRGGAPSDGSSIADSYDVYRGGDVASGLSSGSRAAIVLASESRSLPRAVSVNRSVYIAGSVEIGEESRFQSLYADGSVTLGPGSAIRDWVHAERQLMVEMGCELRGSASAGESLLIYPDCGFERLQAPEIRFGDSWHWSGSWSPSGTEEDPRPILRLVHRSGRLGDGTTISGDLSILAGHIVEGDVVVRGNVRVGRSAVVHGSIKAHGNVIMGPDSRVVGSLFAIGNVHVGRDARVGGVLSSEAKVHVQWGTVIGSPDGPVTVSGRHLLMDQGVRVHGVVLAIEAGRVAHRTTARQVA